MGLERGSGIRDELLRRSMGWRYIGDESAAISSGLRMSKSLTNVDSSASSGGSCGACLTGDRIRLFLLSLFDGVSQS